MLQFLHSVLLARQSPELSVTVDLLRKSCAKCERGYYFISFSQPPYVGFLLEEVIVENEEEEAKDHDYSLPAGVAIHAAHLLAKPAAPEVYKSDQAEDVEKEAEDEDDEISDEELQELLKESLIPLSSVAAAAAEPESHLPAEAAAKSADLAADEPADE